MPVQVYLVSRPSFDVGVFLRFLADNDTTWRRSTGAHQAEEIVEGAGRVCYMSFGDRQSSKANPQYIAHLIAMGHESVLEHVSWGFILTGISRAFSHQLVRHRPGWAFSQLSQQYRDQHLAQFVEPGNLAKSPRALSAWHNATAVAQKAYDEILDSLNGIGEALAPEEEKEIRRAINSAARSVLPNATETKIFVTANARSIRHFLTVRGAITGDEEMRTVSAALFHAVEPEAPSLFADFAVEKLPDGSPIVIRKSLASGS